MASYRAQLEEYAKTGVLPADPTVRVELLKAATRYGLAAEDYRKTHDAGMLKYRIAQLENSQRMLADNQRTAAALQETIGKNGRAAADAATRRANALTAASTAIATKRADFDSRTFNEAAAKWNASNRDAAGAQDAAGAMFNAMNLQGVKYNQANPNTASLLDQYTVMIGAGSLADIAKDPQGVDKVIAKVGAKGQLEAQLRTALTTAIQGEAEAKLASEAIQKGTERIRQLAGLAYANPDAPPPQQVQDEILKLSDQLDQNFRKLAGTSMPEVQAQLQAAAAEDSEYQRLLSEADYYKSEYERLDPTARKSKEVSLGRIVAQPIFQEWAKSNGLNIGTAVVNADGTVTYAPGGDDFKALMRFQYQMQHPDRFGERLFFDRSGSTGTVVKVSYTDPVERERQLARLAYDNGNLVGMVQDGEMTYLTKQQYEDANENNGAEPTGYKYALVGTDSYLKDPYGNVYKIDAEGTPVYQKDAPQGADFADATVVVGGKPARYMTTSDFNSPELLKYEEGKTTDIGSAEPEDIEALAKVSPFKRVPPDQAREIGMFTTIGTLDKMHANTIIKNGVGTISINGGQQVITPDMKPYVREIVHKDGTKLSGVGRVVNQVYAEKLAAEYGGSDPRVAEQRAIADAVYGSAPEGGTTTAPLGTTATATTMSTAGDQIPQPNALLQAALASPNPQAQTEQLERSTLVPPGTSAAVADTLARTPAPAPAAAATPAPTAAAPAAAKTSAAPAAPSAAGTAPSSVAPGAAAAPAAAPAKRTITANGFTYEAELRPGQKELTFTVVSGPGVDKMTDKVIEPGDARYAQFAKNLATDIQAAPKAAAPAAPAAPAPAPAAAAPTAPAAPTPSKVEGRGEGREIEVRRGVPTETTTKTRPSLLGTIVGGLRNTLREDAAGTEEPGLIEALKARREAKRDEERTAMLGRARAEAERQGGYFERAYSGYKATPADRTAAMTSAESAISKAVAEGAMTEAEATAARAKLGLGAAPAPVAPTTASAAKPATAATPAPAPTTAPKPPVEKPDLSAFLPRKSMAERAKQEAPGGIGKPTAEPPSPRMPTPALHQWDVEVGPTQAQPAKFKLPPEALRGTKAPPLAPLGKKPEGAIPKAEPAAGPSTEGAFKPGPAVKVDMERPSQPMLANIKAEAAIREGQAEADKAKAQKAGTLGAFRRLTGENRSLAQDFRPMPAVNAPRDEMMQYERDKQIYSASRPTK